MSLPPAVRSATSVLASAAMSRVRLIALLAALALALGLGVTAVRPSAQAEDIACVPAGNLWHFENHTKSGKSLQLEGYAGPNGTGKLMITCKLYVRKGELWTARGGEVWIPFDVQSVKITSWSDGGGGPVSVGPFDNKENACFRITEGDQKSPWYVHVHNRGDECDTN